MLQMEKTNSQTCNTATAGLCDQTVASHSELEDVPCYSELSDSYYSTKSSRDRERKRRYEHDNRYDARPGKISRGPTYVVPDVELYHFQRIPIQVLLTWLPDKMSDFKFKDYEKYRQICRSCFIAGEYGKVFDLGKKFGVVDIRASIDCRRERCKMAFGFDVIYGETLPPRSLQNLHMTMHGQMFSSVVPNEIKEAAHSIGKAAESIALDAKKCSFHLNNTSAAGHKVCAKMEDLIDSVKPVVDSLNSVRNFLSSGFGMYSDNKSFGNAFDMIIDISLMLRSVLNKGVVASWDLLLMGMSKFISYSDLGHTILGLFQGLWDGAPSLSNVAANLSSPEAYQFFQSTDYESDGEGHVVMHGQAGSLVHKLPWLASVAALFSVVVGVSIKQNKLNVTDVTALIGNVSVWINKVFVHGKNGLKSLVDVFEGIFDDILVFFGYEPISPMGMLRKELDEFNNYVDNIRSVSELNNTFSDPSLLFQIESRLAQGASLRRQLAQVRDRNDSTRVFLEAQFTFLQNWFNSFIKSSAAPIYARQRPVCIMLQGVGGQGKSTVADALVNDLLEICFGIDRDHPNYDMMKTQLVYEYRVDNNDVDAYMNGVTANHHIMVWSEAFQETDGAQRPSRSITTLMACVDTAGYAVPQAFEGKGKIPFNIPIIIITTNMKEPIKGHNQNWKSDHAINRRFDAVYRVSAKDGCKTNDGFLDVNYVFTDPDAIQFDKVNVRFPRDGDIEVGVVYDPKGTPTSYKDVLRFILEREKYYRDTFEKLKVQRPAMSKGIAAEFGNEFRRESVVTPVKGGSILSRPRMHGQMVSDDEDPDYHDIEETIVSTKKSIAKSAEFREKETRTIESFSYLFEIGEEGYKNLALAKGLYPVFLKFSPGFLSKSSSKACDATFLDYDVTRVRDLFTGLHEAITTDVFKGVRIHNYKNYRMVDVFVAGQLIILDVDDGGYIVHLDMRLVHEYCHNDPHGKEIFQQFHDALYRYARRGERHVALACYYPLLCLSLLFRRDPLWETKVVRHFGGRSVSEQDRKDFLNQRNWIDRIKQYKWIAAAFAGVCGMLGLYFAAPYIKEASSSNQDTKVFVPCVDSVDELVKEVSSSVPAEPLETQSSKNEGKPLNAKLQNVKGAKGTKVMQRQSGKTENVPRTAKVALVKPATAHNVHGPVLMKCQSLGNTVIEVDGDYSEYDPHKYLAFSGQHQVRQDNDANALRALIWHNTVCLYLVSSEGNLIRRIGNALFVHTRTALIPRHYLKYLGVKGARFAFFPLQSNKLWEGTLENCDVRYPTGDFEAVDLCSITFPDHEAFPSLMKHIVKTEDFAKFSSIPAVLTTIAPWVLQDEVKLFIKEYHATTVKAIDETQPQPYDVEDQHWIIRKGFSYPVQTLDGDCGAALTAICRWLPRKIIGMHVAGNEKYAQGASVALTQELVASLLPPHAWHGQCFRELSMDDRRTIINVAFDGSNRMRRATRVPTVTLGHFEYEDCEVKDFYSSYRGFYDSEGNICFGSNLGFTGSCLIMGKSIYSGHHSSTVKIEPSIIYGKTSFPSTKLPAHVVDHVLEDGTVVHVKEESFRKLHQDYIGMNQEDLDECVDHTIKDLRSVPDFEKYLRLLSIEEAVFGDEFLKSLNMNSSPGKVWERKRKGNKRGKRTWIDLDNKWIDPELVKAVEEQMHQWQNLWRCKDVFSGESKSELRKPPKHNIPRMYNAGDIVTLINSKRLFGGLVALMQHNWLETGVTVGINCHKEFSSLLSLLQRRGSKVFDGDFGNFDGTLGAPILEAVMFGWIKFLWQYGNFSDADILAMFTFSHCIRFYVCVILGFFILLQKGNPSGQFLTTQLNSVCVKTGLRLCWKDIFRMDPGMYPLDSFDKHVLDVENGDDNVVNISDVVCNKFNQVTVADAFKKLGMNYTDAAKTGTFVPYKSIDEIQYLKRSIIRFCPKCESKKAGLQCCGSPTIILEAGALELDSIYESVLWFKQGLSSHDNFMSTVSSALQEMYHHGRSLYDPFRNELVRLLSSTPFARQHLRTYNEVHTLYVNTGGTSFGFTY